MKVNDIVRFRADFITRQFRTRSERFERAGMVGTVLEVRNSLNVTAVVVRWKGQASPNLCYPQALEVISNG